jgi:hypothetical protein
MATVSLSVYTIVYIMNRSQAAPSLRIGSSPGHALSWLHIWLYGASAVIHERPRAPSTADTTSSSRTYPDVLEQLQADATPSCNRDCLARFASSSDESARHSTTHESTTGFFLRGRVCHINERALYFLIGVALAAVRILHATERRIWTGAYDPKTKEETAHAAHPESYYQCAHYRSLSLLADVPFASCTSCHVFASVRGRIRRQGATCTPKTRTFSHGVTLGT